MRTPRLLCLLSILLLPSFVMAQGGSTVQSEIDKMLPNPVPLSPNAAAIAKYGDYEVSHYTGTPQISIPLYEVKSGSLTIPITLNYHAGGIKYTDQASWVGLGWSLSAGGQVTRQVNGKKDEEFYYHNPYLNPPDPCENYEYIKDVTNNVKDMQPDLFSYQIPSKTGKFMLTQGAPNVARDYYLIPYEPIKIKDDDYNGAFESFQITDENGVNFLFGKDAQGNFAIDHTTDNNGIEHSNAWHLMNVSTPNANDNIAISYQSLGTVSTTDVNQYFTIIDDCDNIQGTACNQVWVPSLTNQSISTLSSSRGQKEIIFEGGKVVFLLGGSRLDVQNSKLRYTKEKHSEVKNGVYEKRRSIQFVYSYFTSTTGINLRLKLDGIQMLDVSNTIVNQHKFTYFTNSFSWDAPNKSLRRDFWGYYNGATGNSDLIPSMTVPFNLNPGNQINITVGGAVNRNTNLTFLKEGVLKKIQFPTGGYTEFDFEEHKYYENSTAKTAGGLRVTTITSNDGGGGPSVVKTYKYGLAQNGYGQRNFSDNYNFYINRVRVNHTLTGGDKFTNTTRTFFSQSSLTLESHDGSAVVYPNVTEYQGTDLSNNGRIEYEYDLGSFVPDVPQGIANSGKTFRSSKSWQRGKLTKKSIFNSANNLLRTTEIVYATFNETLRDIGYIAAKRIVYTEAYLPNSGQFAYQCNAPYNAYDGAEYLVVSIAQSSGAMRENVVTETSYLDGQITKYVQSITTNTYDGIYLQPITVAQTTSNSTNQIVTYSKYPFSYPYNSNETGNAKALRLLKERNVINVPVEQFTAREGSGVNSGFVSTFVENPTNSAQVVPSSIFVLESSVPVAQQSNYTSIVSNALSIFAGFKRRVSLLHNAEGNIKEIWKVDENGVVNDMPVTYAWGYNNSLPIAEIKNAVTSEVLLQNFEDISATAGSAHTGLQYYTGDYTASFTMPNARSYVVDYWYLDTTWKYIRKAYTGTSMLLAEGTAIDDVRIYPADALVTTWTYDPGIGQTASIDPNGRTTFYTYDSFGRLQLISDTDKNVVKGFNYNYAK